MLIKTGKVIGDRGEILSGISEAERVIVAGTEGINEGHEN